MRTYPWNTQSQSITSAGTSMNSTKVPAVFNKTTWQSNTRNADIGGGKFDTATNMLFEKCVRNVIFDPFNRSAAHNDFAVELIENHQCDTCTCANVLNVIQDPAARLQVIHQAANTIKPHGAAYFQIYEGDGSGTPKATCKGWQENRKAETYMRAIAQAFKEVERHGNIIIGKSPINLETPAQTIDMAVYSNSEEGR